MKRVVFKVMGVLASAAASMGVAGAGVASAAPPYYGQTYAQAAEKIQSRGQTPVIATVIGSQLPTDDCIVTSAHRSLTLDSSGNAAHKKTWVLGLNCNLAVAQPGKPGNSVMTPEGQKARDVQDRADKMNTNVTTALANGKVPKCGRSESNATKCMKFCDKYGLCSDEVLKYLASL